LGGAELGDEETHPTVVGDCHLPAGNRRVAGSDFAENQNGLARLEKKVPTADKLDFLSGSLSA
jgi:hypothetical protein